MKVIVEGVELTVTQDGDSVTIMRVVGRDRQRRIDIRSGRTFALSQEINPAITLCRKMQQVARLQTAGCKCDYRYGWSDHAEHCQSINKADDPARFYDD